VRQLTSGVWYEHSIDWSPGGDEILFVSNREPDPDRVFNYDIFTVSADSGAVRRVAATRSAEYTPRWSPDGNLIAYLGTKRPLTSSETTMEDTHAWVMSVDGTGRREVGATIDNRQEDVGWAADGRSVICSVQEGGNTRLYRLPVSPGNAEVLAPPRESRGAVGSWSAATGDRVAYSLALPSSPAELYLRDGASRPRALTSHNATLLADRDVAEVEAFTFPSFDGTPIEAFLTTPVDASAGSRHPLIVAIHGGPHAQQGPGFNARAQVYAAHGFATLMVNYRGSTGYGQKLADAIFKDQDGGEAKDVMAGVDAALARYKWLDASRLGIEGVSYGGQLTNWLITQTTRFKAAIPIAGISNLISFNYTAYYHDYLAVEYGAFPHEEGVADLLWERSPIRYAGRVRTPTMFLHGENDNDVPIGEAEQFFIALKDVGVETILVRYPREGHGLREPAHVVDSIDRSIAWYDRHFER
jgi:dipeptidyl aminopeptidase/acylaminoacyl peptidase